MNYSIHFSPTGGTQKVAAILASAMGGTGRRSACAGRLLPWL